MYVQDTLFSCYSINTMCCRPYTARLSRPLGYAVGMAFCCKLCAFPIGILPILLANMCRVCANFVAGAPLWASAPHPGGCVQHYPSRRAGPFLPILARRYLLARQRSFCWCQLLTARRCRPGGANLCARNGYRQLLGDELEYAPAAYGMVVRWLWYG